MTRKINNSLIKIVGMLSDGQYHDGTTLGDKLRMTRSAVWKTIKKLENYGIPIDSVKGKGYALLEPLILLDVNKIKKQVHHTNLIIETFESIASTNDYLRLIRHPKATQICLAEEQTQGRGRLNRYWHSPFGKNIYLSCLFCFNKDISELAGLSLVVGLAVYSTLKSYGLDDSLSVKWPNDILYENKKLAGILIDIQAETHGVSEAVIGIGIDVNMAKDHRSISQAWTSMYKILNVYIDRNELCARLINTLLQYLHRFNIYGFSPFADEWIKADCLLSRTITLKNVNEKIKGKVTGVNEQGHLLIELNNGSIRAFSSGDTSIMKKP